MRSQAFSGGARPGTSPLDAVPPSLIVQFDDQFFKDRFRISSCQKDALARINEAIKSSPIAREEYDRYINNFKAGNMRAAVDEDGRAAIRMHHFSKYLQYVAKYEEINNNSPLRAKLPANVFPALRKDFFALTESERSRFLVALSELKKSHQWRWLAGLATGSFTADEAAAPNKQLKDTIAQGNTVLLEKAQLHFKEFCQNRSPPADMSEHGFVRPVKDVAAGTYCNDASFALWNRCLVAEFEAVLRSFDPEPSEHEPMALPYWSWESWVNPSSEVYVDEEGNEVEVPVTNTFAALPAAFTAPFVEITLAGRKSLIPNPLLDGPRRAPAKAAAANNTKTARNPVFVDAFLEAQKALNTQYFQSILRNEDFASATAQVTLPAHKNPQQQPQQRTGGSLVVTAPAAAANSLEAVTYYIQNLIGGESATTVTYTPPPAAEGQPAAAPVAIFSTTAGDLASFERSAWDPLFWLIRGNTDRLFCSWQRIHFRSSDAAATIPKTVNVSGQTRLFPFARLEDLGKQRCWQVSPSDGSAIQPAGREVLLKKHTATMENWWSVVSLERYYTYDAYLELEGPAEFAHKSARLKYLIAQVPANQQPGGLAGDHNNTELEVSIGNLPHSGQLFAFYPTANGSLRPLGSVAVIAAEEGSSAVVRFNVLDLLTGPTENPKRSMPPRDMNQEPFWIQDRLVLELRTANRTTVLNPVQHQLQALFDFARFV